MDAKQARVAAQRNLEAKNSQEVKEIEKSILEAVREGVMFVDIYTNVNQTTKDYLIQKGYTVEWKEEGRQYFYNRISW